MAPDNAPIAEMPVEHACAIVLKPLSHPELGDIHIEENLFAIGRTEAPFESYTPDIVADLSRRHARIFSEYGAVYIADLDSKNGTTVNGVNVQQKITRLHDGDEICFAGRLSYRVLLGARADKPERPARSAKLVSLSLTPEHSELGLQPIVISRFPFLISKTDDAFARYKEDYPHQVNYLSRRHAHIFVKGGEPFVEDLGSTNGTFVGGKRLDEHAVPLEDGDLLAIGGHHFVYKVSVQKEETTLDPTVTKLSAVPRTPAAAAGDADKTTFVAAAGSFLDIFCVDHAQQQEDEVNQEAPVPPDDAGQASGQRPVRKRPPRRRFAIFLSELSEAFADKERKDRKRAWWWAASLAVLVVAVASLLFLRSSPERGLKDLLAGGKYEQAATAASQYLARNQNNPQLRALGTEALLKAHVPRWLALLKTRDFSRAAAVVAGMKELARHNPDVQPLVSELEWIGNLEQFAAGRGGADQPIQDDTDEGRVKAMLQQWEDDTQGHQRAFTTISSYVPEFRDTYAAALSHVRKLALVSGQSRKGETSNDERPALETIE